MSIPPHCWTDRESQKRFVYGFLWPLLPVLHASVHVCVHAYELLTREVYGYTPIISILAPREREREGKQSAKIASIPDNYSNKKNQAVTIPNSAHQFFAGGLCARPHFRSSVREEVSGSGALDDGLSCWSAGFASVYGSHISKSTRPLVACC